MQLLNIPYCPCALLIIHEQVNIKCLLQYLISTQPMPIHPSNFSVLETSCVAPTPPLTVHKNAYQFYMNVHPNRHYIVSWSSTTEITYILSCAGHGHNIHIHRECWMHSSVTNSFSRNSSICTIPLYVQCASFAMPSYIVNIQKL